MSRVSTGRGRPRKVGLVRFGCIGTDWCSDEAGDLHDRRAARGRCRRRRGTAGAGRDRAAAAGNRSAGAHRGMGAVGSDPGREDTGPARDRAGCGAAVGADPDAAARHLRGGQELPRARGRVRPLRLRPARPLRGPARAPGGVHQGHHVGDRPVRRHPPAPRRHLRAGLRGRARRDHRPRRARDLPRGRVRARVGLHRSSTTSPPGTCRPSTSSGPSARGWTRTARWAPTRCPPTRSTT